MGKRAGVVGEPWHRGRAVKCTVGGTFFAACCCMVHGAYCMCFCLALFCIVDDDFFSLFFLFPFLPFGVAGWGGGWGWDWNWD